ncbi:MAG: Crp/Fnr family transcriptional regulator [Bacteroidales bacterium]|nr:Crp/Fnr family transcriptional regulator [Bacteroidales bacterium]
MNTFDNNIEPNNATYITSENCFNLLTDEQKEELQKNKITVEFEAGETIIKKGFKASSIIFLEEGLAKLDIYTDKKKKTVNLVAPKSFIGIICSFACANFVFSAVAIEQSRVSLIDITLFEKFIQENGNFAINMIRHMSAITSELVHHLSKNTHKNIEGLLAILLLDFSKIYNTKKYTLPITRKEMGNILGYSKESVINTLSKFNKDGIISVSDKKIEILEFQKLTQIGELG